MNTKTMLAIIAAFALIAAIVPALPSAMAQHFLAPGQTGCNPGQSDAPSCGPPGQSLFNNPGQCQKTFGGGDIAHDLCHN